MIRLLTLAGSLDMKALTIINIINALTIINITIIIIIIINITIGYLQEVFVVVKDEIKDQSLDITIGKYEGKYEKERSPPS